MHRILALSLISLSFTVACGGDPHPSSSGDPDAQASPDAQGSTIDSSCASEHVHMSGAVEVDSPSASTMRIASRIVGVAGFTPGAVGSYSLLARDSSADDFATVGVHDIAITNIKFLTGDASADCRQPGQCSGFVARAGRYEVTGLAPYHATFVFNDLYADDGSSNNPGNPIAGQITGCVQVAN